MNVFLWHVHGSWTTAFVQGGNRYFVPVLPGRGPDGRGRAETYEWPASVVEVTPEEAAAAPIDVVVLQRPVELERLAAGNVKRVVRSDASRQSPWEIERLLEMKTVWHPIGV